MDSPNSTAKMRELILRLAVQGKLVDQDPNDEPASELLKRIKAEKEKLIAEGKIKKQKPRPPITEDEIPYELPQGWEWVRLCEIGETQTGSTPPTSKREYYGNDYAFIKPADISGKGVRYEDGVGLSKKGIEKGRFVKAYSVLMVCIGGSIGKVNFVDRDCSCNQQINAVTPYNDVDFCLVNYNLASPYFQNQVLTNAPSTTLPILSKGKWENIPFPLPPLAEQKRIVAKVDQLMQLCDQLDACQEKASTKYTSLNDAALEKLLSAKTIEEFAEHWRFLCDNFDLIYNDPAHVNKLRQAILQLAVQGKLVDQDPNDEPASELLKRIKAEKEKLITEGKIKKQKPLLPITEDEIPYTLAQGWEWVRLAELCTVTGGKRVPKGYQLLDQRTQHIYIRVTDMKKGTIDDNNLKYISNDVYEKIKKYIITKNDLYITIAGTIGQVGEVPDKFHNMNLTENAARMIIHIADKRFLRYSLSSAFIQNQFLFKVNQMAQPKLAIKRIETTIFPLPPLAEQKCIVAKVDRLMQLCNELETRLNQSKKDSEMLMQAVLHEAFS
jgi:type I restriction enzyme S subunit